MKETRWRTWFGWAGIATLIAFLNVNRAAHPVPGVTNVARVGILILFACVFVPRNLIRGFRGRRDEQVYRELDRRIRRAGDGFEFVVDRFGGSSTPV